MSTTTPAPHELFGRAIRVTIGPVGQQGRVFTGLRMRFEVHKTADAKPNTLKLSIYNLGDDSRHFIENAAKPNAKGAYAVQVEAGYVSDLRVIFQGTLELGSSNKRGRHNHHHQGADWVTEIEAADGGQSHRQTILAKSFGPGTSQTTLVHEVAKALGVSIGKITGLKGANVNHGRTLSGPAIRELDHLCKSNGVRWSIQDGVLHVLPYGAASDTSAFVISTPTGMIGSPEKTEKGIKVVSLLQGAINPARLIDVRARDLSGNYVVEAVTHHGDTHDLDWYSDIEAIPLAS